jgi:hypothetical protein
MVDRYRIIDSEARVIEDNIARLAVAKARGQELISELHRPDLRIQHQLPSGLWSEVFRFSDTEDA